MSSRSLNQVQLIGNLTRDPDLRYTPQGVAVCTFGLATNRSWTTESGEKREDAEFHRIIAWNKLAELCSQLLFKGRKVYVEGRLQTRNWTGQDGSQRQVTEVVIEEMIILDSRQAEGTTESASGPKPTANEPVSETTEPEVEIDLGSEEVATEEVPMGVEEPVQEKPTKKSKTTATKASEPEKKEADTTINSNDIPF